MGEDATVINADKEAVAAAITAEAVKTAGYDDAAAAAADGTAFVFMGHGTSHTAKVSYSQMQTAMQTLGYDNVFVGTVEGEPEDTACDAVIEKVKEAGYTKVILRPLMVVAGDHANNDMAGAEDDSWLSQFNAADCFESVDTQIAGLGEIGDIQQLYVDHAGAAIDSLNGSRKTHSARRVSSGQFFRFGKARQGPGMSDCVRCDALPRRRGGFHIRPRCLPLLPDKYV